MKQTDRSDDDKLIFRKVSEAMNRDERYLALSPIPPCGRGLWHHLLFGPHITQLPGLSAIGRAAMAEELGWPLADFDAAFAEILEQGIAKADWHARVIWLPNALRHNPPQSPNVVKGWRRPWDRIPDCSLKTEAYDVMKTWLKAFGEPFAKAFADSCQKPSGKPFQQPSTKIAGKPTGKTGEKETGKPSRNQGTGRHPSGEDPSQKLEALSGEIVALPRTGALAREGGAR